MSALSIAGLCFFVLAIGFLLGEWHTVRTISKRWPESVMDLDRIGYLPPTSFKAFMRRFREGARFWITISIVAALFLLAIPVIGALLA